MVSLRSLPVNTLAEYRDRRVQGFAWILGAALFACDACVVLAQDQPLRDSQKSAISEVDKMSDDLIKVKKSLWEFAEVGLEEKRSSQLLMDRLERAGFALKRGLADMPTSFVASYGQGEPVIAILAEYDALPGMSQKNSSRRDPVVIGGAGHACGHDGLGTGALGAALALRMVMEQYQIAGTIRLYGTPAEETLIGKVYLVLAGEFEDVDACLHWHPASKNEAWSGSSKALISSRFTFRGTAAHASGSPENGRSALDAVELMNVGANYMREHLKDDARVHYVITNGGGAPNVVPETASVWYYVRANDHHDAERIFRWLQDIAKGAALMSRTKMEIQVETDCHELISNGPMTDVIHRNLERIAPPKFSDEEMQFARELQMPLTVEFGTQFPLAIDDRIHRVPLNGGFNAGSTDVGDISWHLPTAGFRTTCMAAGSPGHSWQNVAAMGTTIGEKGTIYAAKILAATALDLLEQREYLVAARADWELQMKGRTYTTQVPKGQKAPASVR